jgi:urease accessory protein
MKHPHRIIATATLASLLPLVAQAHPGHELHASLAMGLMHPLTGWDHLTVLLCLGVLAAGRSARFVLVAGALLVAALAAGAALGLAFPRAAFVEQAILATVIASVSLLVFRVQVSHGALLALCLGFTLVHGMAHGQEAPAGNLAAYFAGFTLAGAALYAGGVWVARRVKRRLGASTTPSLGTLR